MFHSGFDMSELISKSARSSDYSDFGGSHSFQRRRMERENPYECIRNMDSGFINSIKDFYRDLCPNLN